MGPMKLPFPLRISSIRSLANSNAVYIRLEYSSRPSTSIAFQEKHPGLIQWQIIPSRLIIISCENQESAEPCSIREFGASKPGDAPNASYPLHPLLPKQD